MQAHTEVIYQLPACWSPTDRRTWTIDTSGHCSVSGVKGEVAPKEAHERSCMC